ncbi:phospholipid-binding protein MlaC [Histophilus somni]|uniref:phospholipid-binding protein MlaC n=1 Tax=Histophilus somni TaxID=731 RepID=UPI00201EE0C3|nr:phospholipid-binding protein MlaC [Histophilus somni]
MLKKLFFKIIVAMAALFAVQAMAEETPYELTLDVSERLFKAIDTNQSKIKQDPNYLRTIVRQGLMPYAHVNYAGSLVLGPYFKSTSPEQRAKFFAVFDKFIEYQYAKALTLYSNQKISVLKPINVTADQMNVPVKILQSGNVAPIDLEFYWRKNSKSGKWQVYDMSANGVSTVHSTRQEWLPILRKKGIETLIDEMEEFSKQPIIISSK